MAVVTLRQASGWRLISFDIAAGAEGEGDRITLARDEVPSLLYVPVGWIQSDVLVQVNIGTLAVPVWNYVWSSNTQRLQLMVAFSQDKSTLLSTAVANPFLKDFRFISLLDQTAVKNLILLIVTRRIP